MAAPQASSRLEMLQARFQQRQLLEKEQKLLQLYDQQQLRAHQVAQRGSAGSNGSNSSGNGTSSTVSHHQTVTRTTTSTHSNSNPPPAGGKVRQMFDERRQTSVKGIDKSYPLEPLDNRSRKQQSTTTTTTSNVVVSTTSPMKNGNPMSNRQNLVMRRSVRSEANSNVNGGKPIVSYHEEVTRESCGPTERDNHQEEFGDDDNENSRYANGNRHVDQRNEMHIEDVTNDNFTERHRTTAKIHLSEFDSNEASRVGDNLENEQFPEDLMIDAPDRLPRRAPVAKKPSQSETRLERFKNSNSKRSGPSSKQVAGNTTSYTKKRTETNIRSGSTSRASTVTRTEEEEETSTRGRSPRPEVEATGRPRSSTPEERTRKLTHPVVDRSSIVTKTSGVSKVSQLTHKNSMDFYPRRKSEFEKSKTFRKLQMELGESSPEPAEPEENLPTGQTKACKKRSSILDENIYHPGRRSSSSSPATDRDTFQESRGSREISPEYLRPTGRSESPIYGRKSSEVKEEISTSSVQSHTYNSRRRSSNCSQSSDRHTFEERRASREMSPELSPSRKGSESPVCQRESTTKREEIRTSDEGRHSTNVRSDFYSCRRRSSSGPNVDDRPAKGRRVGREKSPERPPSRKTSASPIYARESTVKREERKKSDGGHDSTNVEVDFYSTRRRSSSSRPTVDNNPSKGRSVSRAKSPERPGSRKGSESPVHGKKSTVTSVEIKTTSSGMKTTGQEANIYCARRRSSSSPNPVHEPQKGRRNSREMSPEHPRSRQGSESPIYERQSTTKREETKSLDGMHHSMRVETSNFYSSGKRPAAASRANKEKSPFKGPSQRASPEKSLDRFQSRKGSESPKLGRKTTVMNVEIKRTGAGNRRTEQKSDVHSSRRRSSSSGPIAAQKPQEGRRCSREISPERPKSRRGSVSPFHEIKSTVTDLEIKRTNTGSERMGRESNVQSSRRRSSSSSPTASCDRRNSREISPVRPNSRRGSESPTFGQRSTVTTDEIRTTRAGSKDSKTGRKVSTEETTIRSESPISVRLTRKRSESPRGHIRRASVEREELKGNPENHRTSGGILRSVELVKKLTQPGSSNWKPTTSTRQSLEKKTTLEDVEVPRPNSPQRSRSPTHKVVKKEKAVMKITMEDKSRIKDTGRRDSSESGRKIIGSRSRTTSPSPPPPNSMKETASSRAKKADRKNSSEMKRIESKQRQHEEKRVNEIHKTNLSHEKARHCDLTHVMRSSSPVDDKNDEPRRCSTGVTVKRHETFNVSKPSQRIMKIDRESSVDDDDEDDLPIGKTIKADVKDKSQLLERIEKIRTTLSRSGRSEQNLQDAKDFERTDSVESALRRFDSIGVETEHHVTVGVDEIDRSLSSPSPEPVQRTTKQLSSREEKITKKSVDLRNTPTKITVAVVKAQPRGIDRKSCELSKDNLSRMNIKHKITETTKSVSGKKEKSATTITPRQSPKPRVNQKISTSLVRKSKLRGEEPSGRGEGKARDRSPECKRKLFDDSESDVETDNTRSTVVVSTYTTVTKSPEFMEIQTKNNRDDVEIGSDDMIRSDSSLREMRAEQEQPTKVLRSIEDIRKSIKRESQDFNRELKKFNRAMRKDEESSSSVPPEESLTSGIISCVKITKTLKAGDLEPLVKIERSTVKMPITHRVAKSPSPDIGVKRSTEGRARTPTASVRRSVPSSPAKSPDSTARYVSSDFKSAGPRPSTRTSPSSSATRENRMHSEISRNAEYTDCVDGPADNAKVTVTETVTSTTTTKKNDAFVVELEDDDEVYRSKEATLSSQGKPPLRKQSTEKSLTSQKTQRSPTATPLPRPASALSTSSTGSARGQSSQVNSKSKMATKTKTPASNGAKGPPGGPRGSTAPAANDGLAPCKICGRRFNSDRIALHEQICSKTATKKRKQFDATIHRVKGTELEQFVVKKGNGKKGANDRKTSKPEVKSNWRRKHEDFINAIRSAKQVQAHLAAGGKLSDLPPPPASDTSDYIQCPHCGRKFNQAAAERHIPKCQNMMHNKPNPRAPPKPKR